MAGTHACAAPPGSALRLFPRRVAGLHGRQHPGLRCAVLAPCHPAGTLPLISFAANPTSPAALHAAATAPASAAGRRRCRCCEGGLLGCCCRRAAGGLLERHVWVGGCCVHIQAILLSVGQAPEQGRVGRRLRGWAVKRVAAAGPCWYARDLSGWGGEWGVVGWRRATQECLPAAAAAGEDPNHRRRSRQPHKIDNRQNQQAHLRMKSFASADTAGREGKATSRAFSMTCGRKANEEQGLIGQCTLYCTCQTVPSRACNTSPAGLLDMPTTRQQAQHAQHASRLSRPSPPRCAGSAPATARARMAAAQTASGRR